MNVLFISCAYSDSKIDEIRNNSKKGLQFAAQTFQTALITGFVENDVKLEVLSFPAVSTFPVGYSKPLIKSSDYVSNSKKIGHSLRVINSPFLNSPIKCEYKKFIDEWISKNKHEDSYILVYGFNPALFKISRYISKIDHTIPRILLVPDLPEYMGVNKLFLKLGLRKCQINKLYRNLNLFDGFIWLTEQMNSHVNLQNKPYIVIEGIYQTMPSTPNVETRRRKTLLYSGALSERYGLLDLLDAFRLIEDPEYRLFLCGTGNAVSIINEYSKVDNRIKYFGTLTTVEVRKKQREVSVLINPRHSSEEFTKFSFPSKTMEYMASGTATLMCPLKCLPSEYHNHLYFFDDESVQGMKERIMAVCELPDAELLNHGRKASEFIISTKNAKSQVKKIIDFFATI